MIIVRYNFHTRLTVVVYSFSADSSMYEESFPYSSAACGEDILPLIPVKITVM
jgi:hypothetical protein